jgi:hypothetical protein
MTYLRALVARRLLPRCRQCRALTDGARFCSDTCATEYANTEAAAGFGG